MDLMKTGIKIYRIAMALSWPCFWKRRLKELGFSVVADLILFPDWMSEDLRTELTYIS
jgi:hypothetical protein